MPDKEDPQDPRERVSSIKAITDAFTESDVDASDELIQAIVQNRHGMHVSHSLIRSVRSLVKGE